MELGRNVKEYRTRLNMSQEQLVQAIFVSRQTISNWETDRTYPDVQSLLLLSNVFQTSVDELIKGDVKTMKAVLTNEAKKLNKVALIMSICGVTAVIWALATSLMNMDWAVILIPCVVLLIPAVISAGLAEKIKFDNKLYTYRAVEAFMAGEDPDITNERNQKAGRMWLGKLAAKTAVAAAIGFCCGWGLFSILSKLLG